MDMGFLGGLPAKLATLITNMTTLLGRVTSSVDVNVSTRAPASTALSNATWTNTKAGYLDMAISGVARIKSIQHVSSTQSAGTDPSGVYLTITIAPVTTSKTVVIFNGVSGSNANTWGTPCLRLTSSTQLSFSARRDVSNSFDCTIGAVVVQFF